MTVTEKECLKAIITIKDYFDKSWTFNDCGCYDKDGIKISMDTGYFFGGLDNIEDYLIIKLRSKKMKQVPTLTETDKAESEEQMSRKITMPKCPYCGKEKKYQLGDYDTSKLVSMATGTGGSDVTIRCMGCGKDYKVSCNIRYYGRK